MVGLMIMNPMAEKVKKHLKQTPDDMMIWFPQDKIVMKSDFQMG